MSYEPATTETLSHEARIARVITWVDDDGADHFECCRWCDETHRNLGDWPADFTRCNSGPHWGLCQSPHHAASPDRRGSAGIHRTLSTTTQQQPPYETRTILHAVLESSAREIVSLPVEPHLLLAALQCAGPGGVEVRDISGEDRIYYTVQRLGRISVHHENKVVEYHFAGRYVRTETISWRGFASIPTCASPRAEDRADVIYQS